MNNYIREIVNQAVDRALRNVLPAIERALAAANAKGREKVAPKRKRTGRRSTRPVEMTKWVADARARRVPNFVIEATGLDTKKKIVAKFGENAAFEKGKPLPQAKGKATGDEVSSVPRAKPPIVRKAAGR
jgi:hypothetical protein